MKNVLIIGGAGKIGYELVLKLLDSKYEITVLDLPSVLSEKKFKKLKNKVKIIYGDIEDKKLLLDIVKNKDVIINYAGIMPPLADLSEDLANRNNYEGNKNIVDAINEVNPKCKMIYASFISVYGNTIKNKKLLSIDGESEHPEDYYSVSLIRSEDYIKNNLENYIILRMPIVLTRDNYYINHMRLNRNFDFMTVNDFNNIVTNFINNKKLQIKTFDISGFKCNSSVFVKKMYNYTGEIKMFNRSLYYGEYEDAGIINKYVDIEYQNINDYFNSMRVNSLFKYFKKIINYPKYLIFKNKIK